MPHEDNVGPLAIKPLFVHILIVKATKAGARQYSSCSSYHPLPSCSSYVQFGHVIELSILAHPAGQVGEKRIRAQSSPTLREFSISFSVKANRPSAAGAGVNCTRALPVDGLPRSVPLPLRSFHCLFCTRRSRRMSPNGYHISRPMKQSFMSYYWQQRCYSAEQQWILLCDPALNIVVSCPMRRPLLACPMKPTLQWVALDRWYSLFDLGRTAGINNVLPKIDSGSKRSWFLGRYLNQAAV